MNKRERMLALILGGFIIVAVVGVAGALGVYFPIASLNKDIAELDKQIDDKSAKLAFAQKDLKRVDETLKRSLPAELDVARQEYDAAINKILRDARVPVSVYTVSPSTVDSRPVPEMAPKKAAYQRIALRVTMKPVDLTTLIDVLHRYYRLNLLHQITAFSVKRIDGNTGSRRRDSTVSDKADLDVTLTTEAIILDGAESRRSLLPIPVAMGAIGGGAGYRLLHMVPEPSRGLTPVQMARVLASTDRDYTALLSHDLFHGPPPPAPVEPPKGPDRGPPPKDDTSPYIRFTGFGPKSDGTGTAFIQDLAGRLEYEIEMKREKGKLVAKVEKFYYTKNSRKSFGADTELDISEETSATRRVFKVIGFDSDSIILTEWIEGKDALAAALAPAPAPRPFGAPGGGFPNGGFPAGGGFDDQFGEFPAPAPGPAAVKGPTRPKVPAVTAVVGGVGYGLPQLKVFAWKHGEPLSKITELFGDERRKSIQRATAPATDPKSKLAGDAGR